jgi:hypothetical protein
MKEVEDLGKLVCLETQQLLVCLLCHCCHLLKFKEGEVPEKFEKDRFPITALVTEHERAIAIDGFS